MDEPTIEIPIDILCLGCGDIERVTIEVPPDAGINAMIGPGTHEGCGGLRVDTRPGVHTIAEVDGELQAVVRDARPDELERIAEAALKLYHEKLHA